MKYSRITYEVWPLDDADDDYLWIPRLRKWMRSSTVFVRGRKWRKISAWADARTFARAKWIANRYPGERVQIERLVNGVPVRAWVRVQERA